MIYGNIVKRCGQGCKPRPAGLSGAEVKELALKELGNYSALTLHFYQRQPQGIAHINNCCRGNSLWMPGEIIVVGAILYGCPE